VYRWSWSGLTNRGRWTSKGLLTWSQSEAPSLAHTFYALQGGRCCFKGAVKSHVQHLICGRVNKLKPTKKSIQMWIFSSRSSEPCTPQMTETIFSLRLQQHMQHSGVAAMLENDQQHQSTAPLLCKYLQAFQIRSHRSGRRSTSACSVYALCPQHRQGNRGGYPGGHHESVS
jgi:hypothetical protein